MEVGGLFHALATLPLGKETPGTQWKGNWVDHRADLHAVMRKIPSPCWELNCGHPAPNKRERGGKKVMFNTNYSFKGNENRKNW
jgi:hypothetical protein